MACIENSKPDNLQILSDRLQLLGDISSRFDALTKETDEKLHNVTKTANILQQKMSPINEQMETLRTRRKGFESCKLFLKQTSSYQATTEKYIQEIHQTKINSVEDYVHSLKKAKESLDFFSNFLPQEKNAENLQLIIAEGTKNLANKFKEIVTSMTEAEKFSREKCTTLATCEPDTCREFLPKPDRNVSKDLALISGWLDGENKSKVYLDIYAEVRSLALCSTLKRLRDGLVGVGGAPFGASPMVSRKAGPKETPSKTRTLPRRPKSKGTPLGLQQPPNLEGAEQPEMDPDDLSMLVTAFVRLCSLEFLVLKRYPFKVERPQPLADQLVKKAKEGIVEDMRKFTASIRRKFRQDPDCLLSLVSVLDRLRLLRPELDRALSACSSRVRADIDEMAKEMQSQALSCLEDYRDEVVKDSRGEGWPLPADGTVHEMTLQALKFLQQLHEFDVTTFEILARRPSTEQDDRNARNKLVGRYLSCTLANLLHTLDFRSEQYPDSVLRSIFLLNNYRYVHQRLNRENMTSTMEMFNCDATKFFEANQQKHRDGYLNKGLQRCVAPLGTNWGGGQTTTAAMVGNAPTANRRHKHADVVKLSDKEKALIKEKFKSFNEEFMTAYKTQSNYSVPDSELRRELIRENKDFLLDKYAMFREKYINVPFTSKKEKYIKFSREDVEQMLENFFRGE